MTKHASPRSLRRNVGSAVVGNLAYTLAQFLMLLAVVRLTDEVRVGQYALALALTAPIFIFAGLKMRHIQVTDAAGVNRSGEYVAVRLLTSCIAFALCVALAFIVSNEVEYRVIIISVAGFKAAEAQIDVLYGVVQRQERLDLIASNMLIRGVLGAAIFSGTLALTDSVAFAVTGLTIMTCVFVVTFSTVVKGLGASPRPEFNHRRLARLVWLAVPLGLSVSVGSLTTNVPRYFLEAFDGTASVGVFATVAYVLVAVSLIGGSAAEAASPRLANLYAQKHDRAFKALTFRLALFGLAIGLLGIVGAAVAGAPLLNLVFGPTYSEHADVLVLLMVAATLQFVSLSVGAAVYAMRLFAVQVPINLLGLLISAASGFVLVRTFGLPGAALSVIATQVALAVCYFWLYARQVRTIVARPIGSPK